MYRRLLSGSATVHWTLAVLLAIATAVVVGRSMTQSRALVDRYGPPQRAVVAERSLEVGELVEADDVSVRQLPAAIVPTDTYGDAAEVIGRTVLAPMVGGLPLVRRHLAPESAPGIGALLGPGLRAVSVPQGDSSVPVVRGDRVDVLATLDPTLAPGLEPTFAVARGALVVEVSSSAAVVAVNPEEAKRVAFAVAQGVVTLAVVPVGGDPPPRDVPPPREEP